MSDLKFDIDIKSIIDGIGNAKKEINEDLKKSVGALAAMTHAKVLELSGRLGSTQKIYKEAVSFQQIEENLWVVTLDEKAMWIEEGRKSGFMEELLRGKSSKQGKNGRYAIIPFQHNKNPTEQTPTAQKLTNAIRNELQARNIPFRGKGSIEKNEDGSPRLGLLHKFNIDSARLKDSHKDSPLKGVAIYQREHINEKGKKEIKRDIMTFRVISEKSKAEGKWIHPGTQPKWFMDKSFYWAVDEWEFKILPEILAKHSS